MEFTAFPVPGHLADWVRSVWYLRGGGLPGARIEILPDGCAEIVFNLGAPIREVQPGVSMSLQSRTMLVGQMTSVTYLLPSGPVACWGVKLHPWALGSFATAPGNLFNDTKYPLDTVLPRLADCADKMIDADGAPAQYAALVAALGDYCARLSPTDALVAAAASMLAGGVTTAGGVRDVARALNTSQRSLELRFARHAGLSPKRYQRIRRFQRVIRIATTMDRVNWGVAAARAGYYDQAHLARDARDIAGCAPSRLFPSTSQVTELFLSES
jgi:AraC-like DNA-binding protein